MKMLIALAIVGKWCGRGERVLPGSFGGVRLLWLLIGPGVLVFLGENDAPSMLSYAATGARFGVGFFLPFVCPHVCDGLRGAGNDGSAGRL